QQGAPAKDVSDDPLPPGATARLGTLRWRQAVPPSFLGFSPDGKIAVSAGSDRIFHVWDFETGKELRQFGAHKMDEKSGAAEYERLVRVQLALGRGGLRAAGPVLSPDGKTVALPVDLQG